MIPSKKSNNMKISFTIIIFVCWITLLTAKDFQISLEFPTYANEFRHQCKDDIALNFSNALNTSIDRNFISSPLITCLNLTSFGIQSIHRDAFDELPNLTKLFISNNNMDMKKFFRFGSHANLKVLIMDNATSTYANNFNMVRFFEKYPNLEILSLRNNYIVSFHTDETIIPKLKIIDLSNNSIKYLHFFLPISTEFINLQNNSLIFLAFFYQMNLLALNLDKNDLKYINYDDMGINGLRMFGLENLHYLSISGNKINCISSNAFEKADKLIYLNLSINNITNLQPDTFKNLQSLKLLDLSFNKFENVPQISNETSILSLNYNNIKSLTENAFAQMPKLTKLLLAGNQIAEINVKAFAQLTLLEILDLSKNDLSFLPERWSESLTSLNNLNLSGNKFTSLESLSLTSVLSLNEVNLMMNPLQYLDVSYIKSLPQNLTVNLM